MASLTIFVVAPPSASYLKGLASLPANTNLVVGNTPEVFERSTEKPDILLYCVTPGMKLADAFRLAPGVRWVHTMAAGLDNLLTPELIESDIPFTNGRGVFKRSLAEFCLAGMLFFSKNLRAMVHNQEAGKWVQFDIEELHGATLGVVGYGEIGQASAKLAHAFGMRIVALRRRLEKGDGDPVVNRFYGREALHEMLGISDYVLVSTPLTPQTRGMIGAAEFSAMKQNAVIINLGRGPVIVEDDLVQALEEKRIRGAVLDVFDREPLPEGHPFYRLNNVLLSPHCADHTSTWLEDAMNFFLRNFARFRAGQPLENLVDKRNGY